MALVTLVCTYIRCSKILEVKTEKEKMTKLLQWLFCISLIFGIWFAMITSNSTFVKQWHKTILFLPVTSLFFFGLYAVTVILYRVFTFNTCESAAIQLQEQIEEARKDLQSKGVMLSREISSTS